MRKILALAFAAALAVLGACATASFETAAKPGTLPAITGAQVYVYSFLDIRNSDLGAAMVAAVNQQLVARLAERGVEAQVLTYSEATGKPVAGWAGTVSVPIAQILAEHRDEETSFGADYRLIIMPASMNLYGANQSYQIRWSLVDAASDREMWMTTLRGDRTVWWSQNEDAEARAATFVNGVIAEMTGSGLLAAAATEPAAAAAAP